MDVPIFRCYTGAVMDEESITTDNLAVVIPCYNSGHRLRDVVIGAEAVTENVIVVDDGSTDGCVDSINDLPTGVVTLESNHGKGFALVIGYRKALENPNIEAVATLDADGQHDPSELQALFESFSADEADFLIGAREFDRRSVPLRSRFGNVLTVRLVKALFKREVPDTQSGFRILSRRFLETVLPRIEGGRYETEMELLAWALLSPFKVVSTPIKTIYEDGNTTSHFRKLRDSWRIYRTLFRMAWRGRPLQADDGGAPGDARAKGREK